MAGPSRAYAFYRLAWQMLDFVFPPRCVGCPKPGTRLCPECLIKIPIIESHICPRCGVPQSSGSLCRNCLAQPPCYVSLRSWARYEGVAGRAVRRLKYKRDIALGDTLAAQMAPCLRQAGWPVDLIVPVALGKNRQSDRGYNQAGLIARPLALALGLPYASKALARWRETRSQVGLSREQRRENVNGVFRAAGERVRGRSILLIDDVATTGSTLSSAAEALLDAGAIQVYAFTAVRAVGMNDPAERGEF